MRRIAWTWDSSLAAVVFAAAVAGSSYTWFQLALHTGWVTALAWVPFVTVDIGGLYFGSNWITGKTRAIRAWGRVTTLLTVAISVVANGIEHAVTGGFIPVTLGLTWAVGAIPASMLFALAHQWSLKRHAAGKTRGITAPKPVEHVQVDTGQPEKISAASAPQAADDLSPRRADTAERVAWFLAWSKENPGASPEEENTALKAQFSDPKTGKPISDPTVRRTKAQARGVA